MKREHTMYRNVTLTMSLGLAAALLPVKPARAHCDTLDGPVVAAAKAALGQRELAPVLRWVKEQYEPEVRAAFEKTLIVRAKGAEAQELADTYFYETVVRLHRAGEGEPYTGLKPAGTDPGPAVTTSDKALEIGSVDALVKLVTDAVADGIRARFDRAAETKKHADESVAAGREYVEAYVEFVHFVERLYTAARAERGAHHEPPGHDTEHAHRAGH